MRYYVRYYVQRSSHIAAVHTTHIDALQLPCTRKAPIGRRYSLAVYMLPGLQHVWCISEVSGREPLSLRQVITLVGYKVLAPTTRPTLTDDVGHFPLFGAIDHDWSRPLRQTIIASHCVLLQQAHMKSRM